MGAHVYFPTQYWNSSGLDMFRPCICRCNLYEFIYAQVLLCLEESSLGINHPLCILQALYLFFLSKPQGKGFNEDNPFRSECSKVSYTSSTVQLWVFVSVLIYCSRRLLWWWLSETLIYGYTRMLLAVIVLLHSLSIAVVFGFPLGAWPIESKGLVSEIDFIS